LQFGCVAGHNHLLSVQNRGKAFQSVPRGRIWVAFIVIFLFRWLSGPLSSDGSVGRGS
jgi:hypothetical protein